MGQNLIGKGLFEITPLNAMDNVLSLNGRELWKISTHICWGLLIPHISNPLCVSISSFHKNTKPKIIHIFYHAKLMNTI